MIGSHPAQSLVMRLKRFCSASSAREIRRQILASDGKLSEEQKRTEEERRSKEILERQTERQEAERRRLESQQEQMNRDHEETLQRHKAEMQKTIEQERRELERKIVSENRRQQELNMNGHREKAARLEARVHQMQTNMDRKVKVTLNISRDYPGKKLEF